MSQGYRPVSRRVGQGAPAPSGGRLLVLGAAIALMHTDFRELQRELTPRPATPPSSSKPPTVPLSVEKLDYAAVRLTAIWPKGFRTVQSAGPASS